MRPWTWAPRPTPTSWASGWSPRPLGPCARCGMLRDRWPRLGRSPRSGGWEAQSPGAAIRSAAAAGLPSVLLGVAYTSTNEQGRRGVPSAPRAAEVAAGASPGGCSGAAATPPARGAEATPSPCRRRGPASRFRVEFRAPGSTFHAFADSVLRSAAPRARHHAGCQRRDGQRSGALMPHGGL